jgi:hypothetical protein
VDQVVKCVKPLVSGIFRIGFNDYVSDYAKNMYITMEFSKTWEDVE